MARVFRTILLVVVGLGILALTTVSTVRNLQVRAHGVRAAAIVQDKRHVGKADEYDLAFHLSDGAPYQAWSSSVLRPLVVGESVTVLYRPDDPDDVQELGYSSHWWMITVLGLAGGIGMLLLAWFTRNESSRVVTPTPAPAKRYSKNNRRR